MKRAKGASPVDVRLRVVALMLEPALALAHSMALPMRDLVDVVEQGYYREARGRGSCPATRQRISTMRWSRSWRAA